MRFLSEPKPCPPPEGMKPAPEGEHLGKH